MNTKLTEGLKSIIVILIIKLATNTLL